MSAEGVVPEDWVDVQCPAGTRFRSNLCFGNVSTFRIIQSQGNIIVIENSTLQEPEGGWKTSEEYPASTDLPVGDKLKMGWLGAIEGSKLVNAHFYLEAGETAVVKRGLERLELGPLDQIFVCSRYLMPNVGCVLRTVPKVQSIKPIYYKRLPDSDQSAETSPPD